MKDYYLNNIRYWYDRHQRLWYYEDNEGNYHFEVSRKAVEEMIIFITSKENNQNERNKNS